jgi:hypothetical protein
MPWAPCTGGYTLDPAGEAARGTDSSTIARRSAPAAHVLVKGEHAA